MQTKYEKHPVSPERKAELRSQGFKIVDARFAPDDVKPEPAKSSVPQSPDDIDAMKKAEVREWLEACGSKDIPSKVADMKDLLVQIMFVSAD